MIEGLASRGQVKVRRITGFCGITSQLIGLTALLGAAIFNSHWFSWTGDRISALGVEGSAKMLYNGGLILAGLLGIMFAFGLGWCFLSGRMGQLATGLLILGATAVSAMGVFPRNWDFMHGASTIAFFVCITLALILIGVAAMTASRMILGLLSVTAGVLVAAIQLVFGPLDSGAIAQLLSCLSWSLWTIAFGIMLLVSPIPLEQGK